MKQYYSFEDIPGVKWVQVPEPFISIDQSKCTGCANCVKVCLAGVFKIKDKKAEINSLDRCLECASCLFICESRAINFSWPKHGSGYQSEWG
ncbi:MAG: 4Fe-4S binding protein [Deltaproteobacteria bacterium]|nr:4Fe-4S binding protein [Deltaproteobacteria bacterium]